MPHQTVIEMERSLEFAKNIIKVKSGTEKEELIAILMDNLKRNRRKILEYLKFFHLRGIIEIKDGKVISKENQW